MRGGPNFVNQRNLKYNEEDGFMRGARIAEKIQEFYNTSGVSGTSQPVVPIQIHNSQILN